MIKLKLRILLLIAGTFGWTAYYAQKDSGRVCLTYKEFDFFADALVERNGLRLDTAILNRQILIEEQTINHLEKEVQIDYELLKNKDNVIELKTKEVKEVRLNLDHAQKLNRRLKSTSLALAVTSAVLGIIVILK